MMPRANPHQLPDECHIPESVSERPGLYKTKVDQARRISNRPRAALIIRPFKQGTKRHVHDESDICRITPILEVFEVVEEFEMT